MTDLEQQLRAIVRDELAKALADRERQIEQLTVAEYGRRWSLSESTVRQAIREGRLEHVRIGRAVRIAATAEIGHRVRVKDPTVRARLALLGGGTVK